MRRGAGAVAAGAAALFVHAGQVSAQSTGANAVSLKTMDIEVRVRGSLASTRVTRTFHNSSGRAREGAFRFELPRGAAITRLAMDVGGEMVEGELMKRREARGIYERSGPEPRDLALLESEGDGSFRGRAFPVPARGTKNITVEYVELLPRRRGRSLYRVRIPAAGEVGLSELHLRIEAAGARTLEVLGAPASIEREGAKLVGEVFTATRGLRGLRLVEVAVGLERRASRVKVAERDGASPFVAELRPPEGRGRWPETVVLAVDRSLSMRGHLGRARAYAERIAAALPTSVRVIATLGNERVRRCRRPLRRCLAGLEAKGASDLARLLTEAVRAGGERGGRVAVVYLGDGAATVGPREIEAIVRRWRSSGEGEPVLHAVSIGASSSLLAGLTRATGGSLVVARGGEEAEVAASVVRRLRGPVLRDLQVEVADGRVGGLTLGRPAAYGATISVLGALQSAGARLRVTGRADGRRFSRVLRVSGEAPRDPRVADLWARSLIAGMEQRGAAREDVVAASLRYGVMSWNASFLAIQTDEESGRGAVWTEEPPEFRGSFCSARAVGDLDKRTIRRHVRLRRDAIRHCYERRLAGNSTLEGTVVPIWWIRPSGGVEDAAIRSSTVADAEVEACILDVIRGLEFPAVRDGPWTRVSYPFTLRSPRAGRGRPGSRARGGGRTMARLVAEGRIGAARRLLERWNERVRSPRELLQLFVDDRVRRAFKRDFLRAALDRLAHPAAPTALAVQVVPILLEIETPARAEAKLMSLPATSWNAGKILTELVARDHADIAARLAGRWAETAALGARARLTALTADPRVRYALAGAVLDAADALLAGAAQPDEDVVEELLRASRVTRKPERALERILALCPAAEESAEGACADWLGEFPDYPRARQRLRAIHAPIRAAAAERRRELLADQTDHPPGGELDRALLERASAARAAGDRAASVHALAERVEMWPKNAGARARLGIALIETGRTDEGCAELERAARADDSGEYVSGWIGATLTEASLEATTCLLRTPPR